MGFSEAHMPLGLQDLVVQNAAVQSVQRLSNSLTRVALEGSVGAQAAVSLPEYRDFAGNAGKGWRAVVMRRVAGALCNTSVSFAWAEDVPCCLL